MGLCRFNHVKITGIKGVVPERVINIDDEIQYYDNDPKKLARNKKILGLGTRHVVEDDTTMCDMCEVAAQMLIDELQLNRDDIDMILVASTSHEYNYPPTACILQGRLNLKENCTALDLHGYGCSGYVHALLVASSMIEAGTVRNAFILVGDVASKDSDIRNRLTNMLFGDAAVATFLEYTEEKRESWFCTGSRGKEFKNIIAPAGGTKLPIKKDIIDLEISDKAGNIWHLWENYIHGMNVFKFSLDVAPRTIEEILRYSGKTIEEIDFFAIHPANKQIIRSVAQNANLPLEKYSSETFTKYGNCATAAVATVICDQLCNKKVNNIVLCTFGVGLSWGTAIINLNGSHNGGITLYKRKSMEKRKDLINYWINTFKQE